MMGLTIIHQIDLLHNKRMHTDLAYDQTADARR